MYPGIYVNKFYLPQVFANFEEGPEMLMLSLEEFSSLFSVFTTNWLSKALTSPQYSEQNKPRVEC